MMLGRPERLDAMSIGLEQRTVIMPALDEAVGGAHALVYGRRPAVDRNP